MNIDGVYIKLFQNLLCSGNASCFNYFWVDLYRSPASTNASAGGYFLDLNLSYWGDASGDNHQADPRFTARNTFIRLAQYNAKFDPGYLCAGVVGQGYFADFQCSGPEAAFPLCQVTSKNFTFVLGQITRSTVILKENSKYDAFLGLQRLKQS